ncbi:uncharacterized protein [Chironomus tepperi]|uniref:uncharacterized protein n=1 Tax=Chironomus tepperi TaxID=113505 RepID=UPI00391F174A
MNSISSFLDSLDPIFFIEILEKKLATSREMIAFKSASLASASGKNDNFISDIYRLTIKFDLPGTADQSIDVILKVSFEIVSEMTDLSLFRREQLMYEDMIKSFEEIWTENGYNINFAPKCYKITEVPCEIMVLEDLNVEGYQMISKKVGLDLQQTKIVLSKLAKFHAASAVRFVKDNKTQSHCLNRVATHVKHSPDSPIISSMRTLFNKLIQVAQTFSSDYSDKMAQWPLDVLMDSYFDVAHPMKCGLMTLAHADLWINNVMLKQDSNGNSIDVKIIDYQMSFWGSPNADLIYLMFTSVMDEVKVKHFDEIIEFYYGALRRSLEMVKYEEYIPTVEELKEDLMDNRMYANQLFLHIIPITRNCSSTTLEIKDLFGGNLTDEALNAVFMDENVLKVMGSWLPFMYERGFLDIKL